MMTNNFKVFLIISICSMSVGCLYAQPITVDVDYDGACKPTAKLSLFGITAPVSLPDTTTNRFNVYWSNGRDTNSFASSTWGTGIHFVTVTDNLTGCSATKYFTVQNSAQVDISLFRLNANGWTYTQDNNAGFNTNAGYMYVRSIKNTYTECLIPYPGGGCLQYITKSTYETKTGEVVKEYSQCLENPKLSFEVVNFSTVDRNANNVRLQIIRSDGSLVMLPNTFYSDFAVQWKSFTVDLAPYLIPGPYKIRFLLKAGSSFPGNEFYQTLITGIDNIKLSSSSAVWDTEREFNFTTFFNLNDYNLDNYYYNTPNIFTWRIRKVGTNDTLNVPNPRSFYFPDGGSGGPVEYEVIPYVVLNGQPAQYALKLYPTYLPIYIKVLETNNPALWSAPVVNSLRYKFRFTNPSPFVEKKYKVVTNSGQEFGDMLTPKDDGSFEFFVGDFSKLDSSGKISVLFDADTLGRFSYTAYHGANLPNEGSFTSADKKLIYYPSCNIADTLKMMVALQDVSEVGEPEFKFGPNYVIASNVNLKGSISYHLDTTGLQAWKDSIFKTKIFGLGENAKNLFNNLPYDKLFAVYVRNESGGWRLSPAQFDATNHNFILSAGDSIKTRYIGLFYNRLWQSSDIQSSNKELQTASITLDSDTILSTIPNIAGEIINPGSALLAITFSPIGTSGKPVINQSEGYINAKGSILLKKGNLNGRTTFNLPDTLKYGSYVIEIWQKIQDDACSGSFVLLQKNIIFNTSNPLPVRWGSVHASWLGEDRALITWQTLQEDNTVSFELESSFNGGAYSTVGMENAAGNTTQQRTYSFVHQSKFIPGLYAYRIKQVDKDGKFSYSKVVTLNKGKAASKKIFISPNPARDVVRITMGDASLFVSASRVEIINAAGTIVLKQNIKSVTSTHEIRLPSLAAGIHFVTIRNEKGELLAKEALLIE